MTPNELRDSVAFTAGVACERRRISEVLRHRAIQVDHLHEAFGHKGYRMVSNELRRLADQLDQVP